MNPFSHEPRKRRTPLQMAEIFAARGGVCHCCKRKLGPRDLWDLDHVIALSCGGTDDDANLAPCCEACHALKTKDDIGNAAEAKQRYAKHVVPKSFQRSRSWGTRR